MKKIATVGLCIAGGMLLLKLCESHGYMKGALDVLDQHNLDSFTKQYKDGAVITYYARNKKGEDK